MDSLFAVVYPTDCCVCGQELGLQGGTGVPVCRACWESLQPWEGPLCGCCGVPFASARAAEFATPLCFECQREERSFDLARSYGLYTGALRTLILQLKFRRRARLGKRLGERLSPLWESLEVRDALLVPVPLHPSRQRQRGFNQAELLAQGLARALRGVGREAPVEKRCLRRTRPTPPQTGLSLAARRENVRGVFAVERPARVRDRAVTLIDDVMTTGATLSACAAALKQAGASHVWALTLARATPQFPDFDSEAYRIAVDEFGREQT